MCSKSVTPILGKDEASTVISFLPFMRFSLKQACGQSMKQLQFLMWLTLTFKALDCNFCLTRYCGNPKNSTQSATSSIFQPRQVGVPSESKVGSYPLSNFVGVFRELLISPSAIFVYRGNKPQSHRSPRWKPCYSGGVGGVAAVVLRQFKNG